MTVDSTTVSLENREEEGWIGVGQATVMACSPLGEPPAIEISTKPLTAWGERFST
jgi:hypothetical protein